MGIMARRGMYNHALWLIHNQYIAVFIQNIKGNILRKNIKRFRFGNPDMDHITGCNFIVCFNRQFIYNNISVFKKLLYI